MELVPRGIEDMKPCICMHDYCMMILVSPKQAYMPVGEAISMVCKMQRLYTGTIEVCKEVQIWLCNRTLGNVFDKDSF